MPSVWVVDPSDPEMQPPPCQGVGNTIEFGTWPPLPPMRVRVCWNRPFGTDGELLAFAAATQPEMRDDETQRRPPPRRKKWGKLNTTTPLVAAANGTAATLPSNCPAKPACAAAVLGSHAEKAKGRAGARPSRVGSFPPAGKLDIALLAPLLLSKGGDLRALALIPSLGPAGPGLPLPHSLAPSPPFQKIGRFSLTGSLPSIPASEHHHPIPLIGLAVRTGGTVCANETDPDPESRLHGPGLRN